MCDHVLTQNYCNPYNNFGTMPYHAKILLLVVKMKIMRVTKLNSNLKNELRLRSDRV